ncbi:RNA-binding domain-containing protein [Aureimonas psammosilenae]|uniref:RNA-binding domain-containing protein n=1 Tax=Aureimonas psammosilenae TaxID=2495496 RepID=UPI00126082A2|nr:RNA-binding domain-containing protein [Aureimonas psammosilenae]
MITIIDQAEAAIRRVEEGEKAADLESSTLDFKEDKGSLGDTERTVVDAAICFANSAGGMIVVGVADKGRGPTAFTGCRLQPAAIQQRIYELTTPHLYVSASVSDVRSDCLLIHVPQSSEVHSDTKGRATQRINTDCIPLTSDDHRRIREEKQGVDWSASPTDYAIDQVDELSIAEARTLLSRFSDERRFLAEASTEDLLRGLGAISSRGTLNRAGYLMFCPSSEAADLFIYQYRNTPGGEPRLIQRLKQPLLSSFLRIMSFIEARQSTTPITLPNGQQISIEDFPEIAVREALSNALCHRDYVLSALTTIDHSPEVFNVTSPGPLVSGVTTENILTTSSRPRNPALTRIARHLGVAEELGRGIDRMYRELIRSGRQLPTISAMSDHVKLTFVGGAIDTQIARFIAGLPEAEQNDVDTMLIVYRLCTTKNVSSSTLAGLLQKTDSECEAILKRLATDTVAILEPTRSTFRRSHPTYRLRASALKELGYAVTYQRRTTDEIDRKLLSHLSEYGKITNRTIQNILDVNVYRARNIISDLNNRGVIKIISEQNRGPKVEWGPGPKFLEVAPLKKGRRRKSDADQNRNPSLFDNMNEESIYPEPEE